MRNLLIIFSILLTLSASQDLEHKTETSVLVTNENVESVSFSYSDDENNKNQTHVDPDDAEGRSLPGPTLFQISEDPDDVKFLLFQNPK